MCVYHTIFQHELPVQLTKTSLFFQSRSPSRGSGRRQASFSATEATTLAHDSRGSLRPRSAKIPSKMFLSVLSVLSTLDFLKLSTRQLTRYLYRDFNDVNCSAQILLPLSGWWFEPL